MATDQLVSNENEKKTTEIQAVKAATINTEAVISVFGIKLLGAVEKGNDGMRILVCRPPKDLNQTPITLESVCENATIPKDKRDSIDSVIKHLGFTGGIAGTEIDVHQVFYYYSNNKEDIVNENIKQEYAFSLVIKNNPKPTNPDTIFEFESISFSLWNSTRKKLVESICTYSISDILGKFSNGQ